jgi:hypothetical protein
MPIHDPTIINDMGLNNGFNGSKQNVILNLKV